MGLGVIWFLVGCLEMLQGFSIEPTYLQTSDAKQIKIVSQKLKAMGFNVIAQNQKIFRREGRAELHIAEFDLIVRDQEGNLCLIEVKNKINPGKKVRRQFSRYKNFLNGQSPFLETIKRVIVVAPAVDPSVLDEWTHQGLEFITIPLF